MGATEGKGGGVGPVKLTSAEEDTAVSASMTDGSAENQTPGDKALTDWCCFVLGTHNEASSAEI